MELINFVLSVSREVADSTGCQLENEVALIFLNYRVFFGNSDENFLLSYYVKYCSSRQKYNCLSQTLNLYLKIFDF